MLGLIYAGIANAIPSTSDVVLEEERGKELTLISTASAPKVKDAETMAVKQAFYAVITNGVEGLHAGQPMLAEPNRQFDYTFYKENKYIPYLTCNPVKLDETKIGGEKRVRMKVSINIATLQSNLQNDNKLTISPAWQNKNTPSATAGLNPTIMVVPYVPADTGGGFETMQKIMDNNPAMKHAVNTVSSQFASHGYKTRDMIATLENSRTNDIMYEGTQADAQTMVIQQLPADIIVKVSLDLLGSGNKGECAMTLDAVERQTAGKLCSVSYASGQYMTNDFVALTDHALKRVENKFFDQIREAFRRMVDQGREMKLEFLLSESVSDWDFDMETPVTEMDFKDELEEWLRGTSHKGRYDMSNSSDKFIAASINIPLWDNDRNRSYTTSNFNSALRNFMKSHFGDAYKASVKSLGQKLIITIE